jgi:hypothetical protein
VFGHDYVNAIENLFRQIEFEETMKAMIEVLDKLKKACQLACLIIKKTWQRIPRIFCNNYRKLHHIPLMRRARCRWRPRESRRVLDGLSPGVVITDEYTLAEEGEKSG